MVGCGCVGLREMGAWNLYVVPPPGLCEVEALIAISNFWS